LALYSLGKKKHNDYFWKKEMKRSSRNAKMEADWKNSADLNEMGWEESDGKEIPN